MVSQTPWGEKRPKQDIITFCEILRPKGTSAQHKLVWGKWSIKNFQYPWILTISSLMIQYSKKSISPTLIFKQPLTTHSLPPIYWLTHPHFHPSIYLSSHFTYPILPFTHPHSHTPIYILSLSFTHYHSYSSVYTLSLPSTYLPLSLSLQSPTFIDTLQPPLTWEIWLTHPLWAKNDPTTDSKLDACRLEY